MDDLTVEERLELGSEAILHGGDVAYQRLLAGSRGQPVMQSVFPALDALVELEDAQERQREIAGLPSIKSRVKGVGAACPECKSTNTRVRDTKGPSRYPSFVRDRVRYHGCADCGAEWPSGPKAGS